MTISDNLGMPIVPPINAGGVTDPLGRAISYSASGLPNNVNGILTINAGTGVISGIYDAQGAYGDIENFTVIVTASNPHGTSISKTFVFGIRNDG